MAAEKTVESEDPKLTKLVRVYLKMKEKKDEIDECDTCGQFSRLKGGLCDWCQRTYESNK